MRCETARPDDKFGDMIPAAAPPARSQRSKTRTLDKWTIVPLWLGILGFLFGVTVQTASPAVKTRLYFAMEREWRRHLPLGEKGLVVARWLQPFVPVWMQVEPGIEMLLDPNDLVSQVILRTGTWEQASWRALQKYLQPGATFVDVGAHIGYYSLQAAVTVGASGRVLAVEPNPETLRKLRGNVAASHAWVITVVPVACADSESTLDLFAGPSTNTGETSLSRANASQDRPSTATYRVRARPLDSIIRESGVSRVDAVKIDVEGAELMVLKGAKDTLDRFHPIVLVEVVDDQLREMGASSAQLIAYMQAHGYDSGRRFDDNMEFAPK